VCLGGGGRGSDVGSCLGFESRLHVDREGRAGGEMEEEQWREYWMFGIERQRRRWVRGMVLVVM